MKRNSKKRTRTEDENNFSDTNEMNDLHQKNLDLDDYHEFQEDENGEELGNEDMAHASKGSYKRFKDNKDS